MGINRKNIYDLLGTLNDINIHFIYTSKLKKISKNSVEQETFYFTIWSSDLTIKQINVWSNKVYV